MSDNGDPTQEPAGGAWNPTQPLFQEDTSADVILRSTDGFDFRARKSILTIASPLFRDMFSVGQTSSDSSADKDLVVDGLRVVPMTEETGEVVEKLLQLCYPLDPPTWANAAEVQPVLAAAIKYQIDTGTRALRKELASPKFLESEPLGVYAVACRLQLQEEARLAAWYTLRHPMVKKPSIPELRFISGHTLHLLFEYRIDSNQAASILARESGMEWDSERDWVWLTCTDSTSHNRTHVTRYDASVANWWGSYMKAARSTLGTKPCSESATSESILKPALKQASKCSTCSSQGFWDLKRFSELLGQEVDKKTKEIAETYDFCS